MDCRTGKSCKLRWGLWNGQTEVAEQKEEERGEGSVAPECLHFQFLKNPTELPAFGFWRCSYILSVAPSPWASPELQQIHERVEGGKSTERKDRQPGGRAGLSRCPTVQAEAGGSVAGHGGGGSRDAVGNGLLPWPGMSTSHVPLDLSGMVSHDSESPFFFF